MTSSRLSHPKYRPDIDGLRAIAVLAVIIFHAFPNWLKGGFIGVDIFFVISGYLISTIIFENLERGTFNFFEFYARRINRIFPALLVVLISCFVFGWFALLADEYKQLGKHIAAGATFISNMVLWNEADYFDNSAGTKPLLHLWSLGIEEQFYIVWPLLLWLAWKKNFNLLTVTVLLAVISLTLNIEGEEKDSVATFYSPQTRFWELLCGSLLAWTTLYQASIFAAAKPASDGWLATPMNRGKLEIGFKPLTNAISFIGFLLLACGFFFIDKELLFPGKWALVPVLGTLLIISAGPEAWLNQRLLSNRLVVWFGVISFPLYLWHWPLLSFMQIVESEQQHWSIRVGAITLAIFLAWITYCMVERPIRFGSHSRTKIAFLSFLMLVVAGVGYTTYSSGGLGFRENATLKVFGGDLGHDGFHKYITEKYYICTPGKIAQEALRWDGFVRCMQSKVTSDIDIALVGDSHAEHLFPGIAEAMPAKNVVFYIKNGAPFLDNADFKNIFEALLASKTIKHVVLAVNWAERLSQAPTVSTLDSELLKTIDALTNAGKEIYLVADVPAFSFSPEKCKGKRWLSHNYTCMMDVDIFQGESETYMHAFKKVLDNRPAVKLLDIGKYFCEARVCNMTKADKILYRDNNHLNIDGSFFVGRRIVDDNPGIFAR